MLNQVLTYLKELPTNDKWLLSVSVVVLLNHKLALLIAIAVVAYFIYRYVKK